MNSFGDPIDEMAHTSHVPLINDANGRPGQIGIVVPDLAKGIRDWGAIGFAQRGWRIWTYNGATVPRRLYHGNPGTWSMTLAMCGENPQLELIEPGDGPSIYHDWLEDRGQGLHHIGLYVSDVEQSITRMEQAGFRTVQAGFGHGADGSGGFAYFDTVDKLGYYLEAIEVPKSRRAPDEVWPSARARHASRFARDPQEEAGFHSSTPRC
jgi:methylmalonyl-CoA/ethylmalonyl-CoA epimerase